MSVTASHSMEIPIHQFWRVDHFLLISSWKLCPEHILSLSPRPRLILPPRPQWKWVVCHRIYPLSSLAILLPLSSLPRTLLASLYVFPRSLALSFFRHVYTATGNVSQWCNSHGAQAACVLSPKFMSDRRTGMGQIHSFPVWKSKKYNGMPACVMCKILVSWGRRIV